MRNLKIVVKIYRKRTGETRGLDRLANAKVNSEIRISSFIFEGLLI